MSGASGYGTVGSGRMETDALESSLYSMSL